MSQVLRLLWVAWLVMGIWGCLMAIAEIRWAQTRPWQLHGLTGLLCLLISYMLHRGVR